MSNGGSTSSCSGTFLDPGGAGNYAGGSSDWTYTICNPTAGQPIYMTFTSFDLWSNSCVWGASVDELFVYNGPNTGSPQIGVYSDNTGAPTTVVGTGGCITFRFHRENLGGLGCSSNSGNPGWSAGISCTPPPPNGSSCIQANPFCTAQTYNFPNSTSNTSPSGPNYGCLSTQPNPIWYYMEVDQSGSFNINLVQTTGPNSTGSGIDVDFALYGPFSSLSTGCNSVMAGSSAPIQCSYSTAFTETIGIGLSGGTGTGLSTPAAAVAGQIYIVLLTNYADVAGYIDFNQTSGTGIADCSILTPCDITALTAVAGACNPATNTYNLTGSVSFITPPSTGTLTVTSSCGGTQTFNAPFSSPTNYSLSGLTANGSSCTVTAAFSADATCTLSQNYTAPASCNSPCYISNLTANIGSCQPDNSFVVNGTFTYQNAPTTGTVTVSVTNGSGTFNQVFNPAFVNGQVYNFSISGIPSDSSPLIVSVTFSAAPGCTLSINSTSPANCTCAAQIGTFTADIIGVSNNNYVLCYGDIIDIQTNNDWIDPALANNPPGPIYDPGVSWLIYSCPPSVGLVPTATEDVANDPCLLGLISDFDLNDLNDMGIINAFPAGTFSNNTVYYVPITMYSIATSTYSYVNTSVPCYDLGTPYAVQYLPQITNTLAQTCTVVTATISGGLPAVNGSQFTAVVGSLTPANATFGNTSCSNGGTITINGLTAGQAYSFQVQDANGCPKTISGTFTGPPTLTYPQTAYCKNGTNPAPTITGAAGGTYTASPAGLSINSSTGVINLAASTAGTYTVTYTTPAVPGPACPATFIITINPVPVIVVPAASMCLNTSATLTAAGANTYSWSPSATLSAATGTSVTATPAATTTYTILGTTTATGCVGTTTATVTVNPLPTVNAGVDQAVCAGVQVTLTASGASTYTWTNGVVNGMAFTPVATTTYTVTGTDANGCVNTDQVIVTVNPIPTVNAGNDISICDGETAILTASGANVYTWDNGITNGVAFTPAVGSTTYTVTGTTTAGCVNTDQVVVNVNLIPVITFTPNVTMGCAPLTVNFTNTTANTTNCIWTMSDGTVLTGCGTVSNTFEQAGCYDITLTSTDVNGCSNSFTAINLVCVEEAPDASFSPSASVITELNPVVNFQNNTTGATNYVWSFGDNSPTTTVENPTHDYSNDEIGDYLVTLIAYSPFGCTDTAYSTIQIQEELIFYVPNTFTPDDDDYNPIFKPIFTAGYDPYDYTLLIFNRWGELIFESHNTDIGWDGSYGSNREIEMVQDGTYTWKIEFKVTVTDERKMVVGHVNVIR